MYLRFGSIAGYITKEKEGCFVVHSIYVGCFKPEILTPANVVAVVGFCCWGN